MLVIVFKGLFLYKALTNKFQPASSLNNLEKPQSVNDKCVKS